MRIFKDYGQVSLFGDDNYERRKERVFCKLIINDEVHVWKSEGLYYLEMLEKRYESPKEKFISDGFGMSNEPWLIGDSDPWW